MSAVRWRYKRAVEDGMCGAIAPSQNRYGERYYCTLAAGHAGEHVAKSHRDSPIELDRWKARNSTKAIVVEHGHKETVGWRVRCDYFDDTGRRGYAWSARWCRAHEHYELPKPTSRWTAHRRCKAHAVRGKHQECMPDQVRVRVVRVVRRFR